MFDFIRLVLRGVACEYSFGRDRVRRATGLLHAALEAGVRQGLILRNPQANTTPPKVGRYEPRVPSPDQMCRYLTDARATATPALFGLHVTAATCGLRIGELTGLPDGEVDLPRRLLRVRQTLLRGGRHPAHGQPKTDSGMRTILLPDVAVDAIRAEILWKKEQRLRLGPAYRDCGLLFVGEFGRPLNPSNIRNRDHLPRLTRLGLSRFRLHDFRHFHATQLIASGVDYRTVGDRLGHRSPSFTLSTYSHAAVPAQEHAARVANGLLTESRVSSRWATSTKHRKIWWAREDLNLGPLPCQGSALTPELRALHRKSYERASRCVKDVARVVSHPSN